MKYTSKHKSEAVRRKLEGNMTVYPDSCTTRKARRTFRNHLAFWVARFKEGGEDTEIDFINDDVLSFTDDEEILNVSKGKNFYRPLTLAMYLNQLNPEESASYVKPIVGKSLNELQVPLMSEDD